MKKLGRMGTLLLAAGLFAWVLLGGNPSERRREPSVHIRSAEGVRQENGTYRIYVTLTAETTVNRGEQTELTVFCGDEHQSILLTRDAAAEVHSLEFRSEVQPEAVRAVLEGAEDAVSPVDGERVLTIQGGTPGAQYELKLVAELWQVFSCPMELCPEPERAIVPSDSPGAFLEMDSGGYAVLNLTQVGLPDGLYLLKGEGEVRYVCLPRVDAAGDLLGSTVTIAVNP